MLPIQLVSAPLYFLQDKSFKNSLTPLHILFDYVPQEAGRPLSVLFYFVSQENLTDKWAQLGNTQKYTFHEKLTCVEWLNMQY